MGLKIEHLSGGYAGNTVLKDVSFSVDDGKIVALIGLNGAGKSTTINHLIGELQPENGHILLNNVDIQQLPTKFKQQISYIPEQPILYDELTLEEHLHLMLAAHGKDNDNSWAKAKELLQTFRLQDKLHWLPSHFSKGMRQKVMLVSAFMLELPLLIVDEPFLGLDTLAQRDVVDLIKHQAQQGSGVLLTTHLVSAAVQFVDTFVLLHEGQVRFSGSAEELAQHYQLSVSQLDHIFEVIDHTQEGQHA